MATGDLHKRFCENQSSSSRDMLADRQTDRNTHRQTDCNTPLPQPGQTEKAKNITLLP